MPFHKRNKHKKLEAYYNKFNNIFHGIIAGPLLVFVILYLQLDTGRFTPPFGDMNLITISVIAFFVNLGYIYWVFTRFKNDRIELIGKFDLRERLHVYREISARFYVLITLSGVLAIIAVLLTGEMSFALIYLLQLFLLSVYRPSVHNICKYLKLQGEEREFVLKKKEFESK